MNYQVACKIFKIHKIRILNLWQEIKVYVTTTSLCSLAGISDTYVYA